jgi:hypothetical protein
MVESYQEKAGVATNSLLIENAVDSEEHQLGPITLVGLNDTCLG